jgi:hypothetical protein
MQLTAKNEKVSEHQLNLHLKVNLCPVILATQEAEIRRITVQNQTRQIVCKTPLSKKPITKKKGWWINSRCRT